MVRMSDIFKKVKDKNKQAEVTPQPPPEQEEAKKEAAPEIINQEAKNPPVLRMSGQVEVSRVVLEKTNIGKPAAEEIYQELLDLIKDILARGEKQEPIEGKEIMIKANRAVDQMFLAEEELIGLTTQSTPDNYLYGHSVNVCIFAITVGLGLGYDKPKLAELGAAGLLHDIGMSRLMDIARTPRKLTKKEFTAVKQHPIYGVEILQKAKDLSNVVIYVVGETHERMTGNGYPEGLKSAEINESARIIGLVDAYEALTHERPYRKKILPYTAMKEILKDKTLFDPRFLRILIDKVGIFPVGSWVELNTGQIGKVAKIRKGFPLRPVIDMLFDSNGRKLEEGRLIDLSQQPTLYIKKPLDESSLGNKLIDSR